jgi:hypothetical protein
MKTQLQAERRAVAARATLRILATFGAIALTSCTPPPSPLAGLDPSDPAAPVAGVGHRSTIGGYRSQRPVEPQSWIEQNQRVAPQPDSRR